MAAFSVTLPSGEIWTPKFVSSLNQDTCIGCARCVKVCANDVLQLAGVTEDGDIVVVDPDNEDDDEEYERKVMTISRQVNCVGCQACSKVCPKKCYTHAPVEV
ncbi:MULTISPECIES: ferredoxin III, nif-specific [Methyloversatilis]|jgi:Nif-specific ferredoxin III|uniref:ferredoxin III, nif-specific n=1 Tax=Methyloversatilis TaxID=378210 RepID=UPI00036E413C|nr:MULTISPECIES: ferredoxin III, nif-specific [Methyloversatilis]MBT9515181.1 ferredoxin III, nif-specific [Methyloversatilis discipulorum]MBV5286562.1 ferredoxin III, nif-specific [Methyloversatilis discipulorum]MCR6667732.1 ferredoxin III, nif-specific [Methyloversatilis sp.]